MNLNTTKFFNSDEVHISSRMNEYMKKNFGYEVEGDIDTLREARKSLQAEQLELKKEYMSKKYVENMFMIETITALLKAHGKTLNEGPSDEEDFQPDGEQVYAYDSGRDYEVDQHIDNQKEYQDGPSYDNQKSATKISMAKLKAGDEVQILAKGPGAERNGLKRGENPYGEGNEVKILGFGVVPHNQKASKNHVMADSLVDFKDLYKKEIRNLKSDEDYERGLQMKFNPRARLHTIVNDIVPKPGYVGFIYQSSKGPGLLYISQSIIDDKWAVNFSDDMEFDLVSGVSEAVKEDIYDDGKLRLDPKTGKYDPEEVKQMQKQGAEMARQKANKEMRDKLNRDIDVSQKAHTITVDYDLELDTPKSKNPLLKKHYQLMKKFNVFISMPEWEEGPKDSGFGAWFANVRGSKENLKGWLKAWEYDYDERDYEDMGLGESVKEGVTISGATPNTGNPHQDNTVITVKGGTGSTLTGKKAKKVTLPQDGGIKPGSKAGKATAVTMPEDAEADEEKGPDHYRWKNESQLAVVLGRIESAMEELDHAIEYRGENSREFFNNGDRAGVGSLLSIKGTLQKVLDRWEKDTEFYGM